jgi:hypothetical protein
VITIGIYATIMEMDDLKFSGTLAEEAGKLGFKPDENGTICLDRADVERIFNNCLNRTGAMRDGEADQLSLISVFLDSSRNQLLFG